VRRGGLRRSALRRKAGGDVFGALDFIRISFVKDALVSALFRDDLGAGLGRIAVGLLWILIWPQTAFWAESHSTASPREVVIAHN
jgi:hypothetical protein